VGTAGANISFSRGVPHENREDPENSTDERRAEACEFVAKHIVHRSDTLAERRKFCCRPGSISETAPAPRCDLVTTTTGISRSQRRLPHNQDLMIGSLLVAFFVVFGMVLCFAVIQPVLIDERIFTLLGGVFLGFSMTYGAVRIAQFQSNDGDENKISLPDQ
jgi:hypothetical protein